METCTPKKVGYVRLSVSRVEAADALMATVVPALADGAKLARLRVWAPESLVPGWARAEGTSQASGTKRSRDLDKGDPEERSRRRRKGRVEKGQSG